MYACSLCLLSPKGRRWLVPVLHMFLDLSSNAAHAIEFLIECRIEVVDDHTEIAFKRVVIDGALAVAINTIVNIGDGRFHRPIRDAYCWIFDDVADHIGLEGSAVSEHPVRVIIRHS